MRKMLYAHGYRFRVCDKRIVGHPDIVIPRCRTLVEVRGCFWHRHPGCKYATTPSTNSNFWLNKFEKNIANDRKHFSELSDMGWQVLIVWECEIKHNFDKTMENLVFQIKNNAQYN